LGRPFFVAQVVVKELQPVTPPLDSLSRLRREGWGEVFWIAVHDFSPQMDTNEKTIDTNICGHLCFSICVDLWNGFNGTRMLRMNSVQRGSARIFYFQPYGRRYAASKNDKISQ
jgi:hypothetical protein